MQIDRSSKIAIILLNWNNTQDSFSCIESIIKGEYENFHIYIVDNGSKQKEKQKLIYGIKKYKKITPIYLSENSGFAAGNNTALKNAVLNVYDYYLLLNNDTIVAEDFLESFLACAKNHPNGGAFGSKICYFDEPDILWYGGGDIRYLRADIKREGFRKKSTENSNEERKVSFITGCVFLIPHRIIERVGYLNENYFSYFEDMDFSIRINQAGFSLWYCPKARVWHKVGAGSRMRDYTPYYLYYQTRNRWIAFSNRKNIFYKIYLLVLNFFVYVFGRILYILLTRSRNKNKQVKAVFFGFIHSLKGRMGRDARWEKVEE